MNTSTIASSKPKFPGAFVVSLCVLAMVFEGFDLQAPGVTVPSLATLFDMKPDMRGWFLSASTFGMLFGALIGGRVSDRIGRKWVLIGSIAVFGALSCFTAMASSVSMLLWARFITGIGLGGALPNLIALAVESTSHERRHVAVGLLLAGPPVGGALVSLVAAVAYRPEQWPMIYLVGGLVPLLVVAPILAVFLPNRAPSSGADQEGDRRVLTTLFGEGRLLRTLAVWVAFFCVLLVLFLLIGWLPSLLIARGLSRPEASLVQMVFNLAAIAGSVSVGAALDHSRHKVMTVSVTFALAMSCVILLAASPATMGFALVLGGLVGATVIGAQTIVYALAPNCYPRSGRGTGMGFSVAAGRFGSAAGPLLAGALVGSGQSATHVLGTLLPIIVVAGVACAFVARSNDQSPVKED